MDRPTAPDAPQATHEHESKRPAPGIGAQRAAAIRTLQGVVGNRAMQRLASAPAVQTKLTVGAAGDSFEQEADRVADRVIAAPVQRQPEEEELMTSRLPGAQRQAEEEELLQGSRLPAAQRQAEEEELLQGSRLPGAQRQAEEEELLQGSRLPGAQRQVEEEELMTSRLPAAQREVVAPVVGPEGGDAGPDVESSVRSAGGGQSLPGDVQAQMSGAMGADFSGVRVHADAQASSLNQSLGAEAFTTGSDMFFAQGRYNPGSTAGRRLIAHELTHVVQQSGDDAARMLSQRSSR
ncbi:MAG: DUF4157 domain-containing protein, partial [Chloroflexi bacterium]|nr:DUF4157 domain-containing protein [Chloroflexota bacterium]